MSHVTLGAEHERSPIGKARSMVKLLTYPYLVVINNTVLTQVHVSCSEV